MWINSFSPNIEPPEYQNETSFKVRNNNMILDVMHELKLPYKQAWIQSSINEGCTEKHRDSKR
jgi:hypothetical protein